MPSVRLDRRQGDAALARRGDASSCCAQRAGSETDAAVKYEIETGLALAALDGTRSGGAARGDRRRCRDRLRPEVRNRLAALLETGAGRQRSSKPTPRSGARRPRPCRASTSSRELLLGHRDAVLRPEPRLGAGAGRDRAGHHVRRHGRHQHGARRADDARRLHDLRRAAGDAGPHRRVDSRGDSGGVPRRRRSPASLLERTIIRFLYGRPLETLLATFGVSLVLQQLVRSVFSANNRSVETPAWMSGTLQINEALAHHLQPPLHRRLHADRVRDPAAGAQAHAARASTSGPSRRTARWRGPWASAATGSMR